MDPTYIDSVHNWAIPELRTFLKNHGVVHSNFNKQELVEMVLQCQESKIAAKDNNKCVDISVYNKLYVENGMLRLPNPDTLRDWEEAPTSIPDITRDLVEEYFQRVNRKIGITTGGGQALSLGKGLAISGHVLNVNYHAISPKIGYCFVKGDVARQVHYRENPYLVWLILDKDNGAPQNAYCACAGG